MEIRWNAEQITAWTVLPAAVADTQLKLASGFQLKVLLWAARHMQEPLDLDACAAAVGQSPAECAAAIHYWVAAGLLQEAAAPAASPAPASPAGPALSPGPAPAAKTAPAAPAAEAAPAAPMRRPVPVKPQLNEVVARQADSPQFAALLDTVSARLGRPLSGGDMETLLYLFDSCGMPAEVLVMIVNWAVSHGRGHMRYIEKMALDWSDKGLVTIEAAEEYLCRQERCQKAFETLAALLELKVVRPSAAQTAAADRWLNDWKLDPELIRLAYARTVEKIGRFQVTYMDRILDGWQAEGITRPEQLEGQAAPAAPSSLDTGGYEELVSGYVPVYPVKKKE